MSDQFVMCTRSIKNGRFTAEPGPTTYLLVPEGTAPSPCHAVKKPDVWFKKLRRAATWGKDARVESRDRGDLLIFIHGYNNDQEIVMARHAQLKQDLASAGFKGEVLSFDWPSNDMAINYLEDRHDAKKTAMQLVTDGIHALAAQQTPDCAINIHVLAHSTGAYVIREAFDDADDSKLYNNEWTISQIVLIGGDISSASMSEGNSSSDSLYRHCVRLTNYSNLYDSVLKLSNTKRLGIAPRVGRVGLPSDMPSKAVNVDCTEYFNLMSTTPQVKAEDQQSIRGAFEHSWHVGNKVFARDLFETLRGDIDRTVIPTRSAGPDGRLKLIRADHND